MRNEFSEIVMTKLSITMLAGAALFAAVPATAQTNYDPYPTTYGNAQVYAGQNGYDNRLAQLNARLEAGVESGAITRTEARPIRQQIRYLAQLEQRYADDGLTQQERRDLQQRYRYTRQQLRAADPSNSRYAQWDRDPNYDPFANTGYNNGSGYNAGTSQYAQVNEVCRSASGLKGILGSVFGTDRCLRVGERVSTTAGLSSVPAQYRDDFPANSAYTYAYIDGNVVQIDARTAVVTNIYDVRYGG